MTKKLSVILLAGMFGAIFIGGRILVRQFPSPWQVLPPQSAAIQNGSATIQSGSAATQTQKFAGEVALVARVIDGDTIELDAGDPSAGSGQVRGEHMRYIGMDTPEVVDPRKQVGCFGAEARERNKELVEGKLVVLVKDVSERDKYGRLLRYVWVGDTFVNLELVKEGYATALTYPPDVAHAEEFVAAEKEAREAKRGLWGACSK